MIEILSATCCLYNADNRPARALRGAGVVTLASLGLLLGTSGCNSSGPTVGTGADATSIADPGVKKQLFDTAIDNLNHLEQFHAEDMLGRIVEHLNESIDWSRPLDWHVDPLVASLPESDRDLQPMRDLVNDKFLVFDCFYLQEAVTLRNIARDARGQQADELARARHLFDWVVRNIALMQPGELGADSAGRPLEPNHLPYQTIFLGRGEVIDRAWVFVLLCRQLGIDAVVLALPGDAPDASPRPWAVGVLVGGELYVFDPQLGLPIPAADGQGVAKLSELAADDALLRRLDLDAEHPFPVTAAQLAGCIALVEGSPGYLSKRMKLVESRLTGDRRIVLTTQPASAADALRKCPGVHEVQLWRLPFQRLRYQASPDVTASARREMLAFHAEAVPKKFQGVVVELARGRTLHLAGKFAAEAGEASANRSYQRARVADEDLAAAKLSADELAALRAAKQCASYWLALVAFERGRYDSALEHLDKRVLASDSEPTTPWREAGLYLKSRAHEELGQIEPAVAALEATSGLQRTGNLLRARWLRDRAAAKNAPTSAAK